MNDFGEINGPDGEQILVSGVAVPCGNHSRADEARANGRLFFAAPAMFEALDAFDRLLLFDSPIDASTAFVIEGSNKELLAAIELGRKALHAARGEK